MALITESSDPELYANLLNEVIKYETPSGWVIYDQLHYRVLQDSSGDIVFEEYDSTTMAKSTSL